MADLVFYINNLPVPPPNNWQGVDIEVSFETNAQYASIKTATYEWLGSDANALNKWISNGLLGGLGIYEGTPFRIEACNGVIVFDGVIDMTSADTTFSCDIIKAAVKETNRYESVIDLAEGFTFAYLASEQYNSASFHPGSISTADYIPVPYVISVIPDYLAVGTLIITTIELIKLIKDAIQTAYHDFETAATAFPVIWEVAEYVIMGIIVCAYAAFLTLLTVNTLLMLINEIVQPIKFKYGMRVVDLFKKACAYLGLTFSSTILQSYPYNNLVIIPAKNAYYSTPTQPDQFMQNIFHSTHERRLFDDTLNELAYGYYDGTFSQLILEMEKYFNAKMVMKDSVIHLERWDYWNNTSSFIMPNQSSEAPFEDPHGTNASELTANYFIQYETDSSDDNTLNIYDGTQCEMTMTPRTVNISKNVLLKGLTEINIPYALAKRKLDLTLPEKVVNKVLNFLQDDGGQAWDLVGGPWNTVTIWAQIFAPHTIPPLPPPNYTDQRIGAMLLSGDQTGVQKILVVNDQPEYWQRLDGSHVLGYSIDYTNNDTSGLHMGYTDANFLARCFHSASWGVNTLSGSNPATPRNLTIPPVSYPNQYLTYKQKEIPLCCSDFKGLIDNNVIKSVDLKPGRIDSLRWNPFNESAVVDFRIKSTFTKNLTQIIVIDGQS